MMRKVFFILFLFFYFFSFKKNWVNLLKQWVNSIQPTILTGQVQVDHFLESKIPLFIHIFIIVLDFLTSPSPSPILMQIQQVLFCFVCFLFLSLSPLEAVWSREKSGAFCFYFQFSVRPIIQKLAWLCYLYSIFIFNKKKSEFE